MRILINCDLCVLVKLIANIYDPERIARHNKILDLMFIHCQEALLNHTK
jgi:hypothetical protein